MMGIEDRSEDEALECLLRKAGLVLDNIHSRLIYAALDKDRVCDKESLVDYVVEASVTKLSEIEAIVDVDDEIQHIATSDGIEGIKCCYREYTTSIMDLMDKASCPTKVTTRPAGIRRIFNQSIPGFAILFTLGGVVWSATLGGFFGVPPSELPEISLAGAASFAAVGAAVGDYLNHEVTTEKSIIVTEEYLLKMGNVRAEILYDVRCHYLCLRELRDRQTTYQKAFGPWLNSSTDKE